MQLGGVANRLQKLMAVLGCECFSGRSWHYADALAKLRSVGNVNLQEVLATLNYKKKYSANYRNLGSNGRFVAESISDYGFHIRLCPVPPYAQEVTDESHYSHITVWDGAAFPYAEGRVMFDDLQVVAQNMERPSAWVRKLFETTDSIYLPTVGVWRDLYCPFPGEPEADIFEYAAHGPESGRKCHPVLPGRMTYIRMAGLRQFVPDELDVEWIGDDGVLIYTTRDLFSPVTESDLATARRIMDWLNDLCVNQSPVLVHGWPKTEEELAYASAISGAPPGRVYRVGLADFAGYDASRGVLLDARLFPFENSFDYKPTYVKPLHANNVVAEARRQLRSVELVGADNPIEWHIGVQEMVEPLKVLLHGHAGLSAERLRIVYTPIQGG